MMMHWVRVCVHTACKQSQWLRVPNQQFYSPLTLVIIVTQDVRCIAIIIWYKIMGRSRLIDNLVLGHLTPAILYSMIVEKLMGGMIIIMYYNALLVQISGLQMLSDRIMVRVGGGWKSLDHFLLVHDPCRIEEMRLCKL